MWCVCVCVYLKEGAKGPMLDFSLFVQAAIELCNDFRARFLFLIFAAAPCESCLPFLLFPLVLFSLSCLPTLSFVCAANLLPPSRSVFLFTLSRLYPSSCLCPCSLSWPLPPFLSSSCSCSSHAYRLFYHLSSTSTHLLPQFLSSFSSPLTTVSRFSPPPPPPQNRWRLLVPLAAASRPCCRWSSAFTTLTVAALHLTEHHWAISTSNGCAAPSRWCHRPQCSSPRPFTTTLRSARTTPHRKRLRLQRRWPTRMILFSAFLTATTRWSATRAPSSRVDR